MKTKRISKKEDMLRFGIVQIEDVLPYAVEKQKPRIEKEYHGKTVYMDSIRYRTFAKKGCKCVTCGIEGRYFAVERHENSRSNNPNRCHLNMYAVDEEGDEVLMTVDHIIPESKGGKRILSNLQTMCTLCNKEKGDSIL